MPNYAGRIQKTQAAMREQQIDALVISAPADLFYLIGYHFHATERLTALLILPEGQPTIVMPQFEVARLAEAQSFLAVQPWTETENPVQVLERAASDLPAPARLGVSDQMWAGFLVGMLEQFREATFTSA